jgi:DivIVA domain-containing protein
MSLESPRFTSPRFGVAYDMGEVDDAIDRIFAALAEPVPTMTRNDVLDIRFTPVQLRKGYAVGEVDEWLDLAATELERRAGDATPAEDGVRATTATYVPETRSDAITEVKPTSSRVLLVLGALVVLGVLAYALFA